MDVERRAPSRFWLGFFSAVFAAGLVFHLIWTGDMEYKWDEAHIFSRSQKVGVTETWPAVGMPSGVRLNNPPLSTWIFVAAARVFSISEPIALARFVQWANILGIALIGWIALKRARDPAEKEYWLWSAAFLSVNPIAVLLHRKIWAQSVLLPFVAIFLIGWLSREKRWGAIVWGLFGALLGQIHMSGFFFSAAVFLWTLIRADQEQTQKRTPWKAWIFGSALGSLTLLPWLGHLFSQPRLALGSSWQFGLEYWMHWLQDSAGVGLKYSLHSLHFKEFLAGPLILGHSSDLVGCAHGLAIALFALILIRAPLQTLGIGFTSPNRRLSNSVLWGFGLVMALGGFSIQKHYLLIAFPVLFFWLAQVALSREESAVQVRRGRHLLAALCVTQAIITACFLIYIHQNGGAPGGDYGVAYDAQPVKAQAP